MVVEVNTESEPLPASLTVSGIIFRITKGSGEGSNYEILLSPQQRKDALSQEILHQIQTTSAGLKLADLLSLLQSYENVKSSACSKCNKVFDSDIKLPILRERSQTGETQQGSPWRPLHQSCVT